MGHFEGTVNIAAAGLLLYEVITLPVCCFVVVAVLEAVLLCSTSQPQIGESPVPQPSAGVTGTIRSAHFVGGENRFRGGKSRRLPGHRAEMH